jgi:hypothetical protein
MRETSEVLRLLLDPSLTLGLEWPGQRGFVWEDLFSFALNVDHKKPKWAPGVDEWVPTLLVAVLLTLLRVRLQAFFRGFGKAHKVSDYSKFAESMWKMVYYVPSFSAGLYLAVSKGWFPETANCWVGVPNQVLEPDVRAFYLFQLGFYLHSTFAHLFMEVRRKDFWEMLVHHIVTLWLIFWSYGAGYHRIGVLVLFVHDIGDIFLELGKIGLYLEGPDVVQHSCYVMLLVVWLSSRLYVYPFYIIRSTLYETPFGPYWWAFNVGLMVLLVLHVYWFYLIIMIGVKTVRGQGLKDIREEHHSEAAQRKAQAGAAAGGSPKRSKKAD